MPNADASPLPAAPPRVHVDWRLYKCCLCGSDLAQRAEGCPGYPAHRAASGEHDPIGERYLYEAGIGITVERANIVRMACEVLLSPLVLPERDGATLGGYCATTGMGLVLALREAGVSAALVLGRVNGEPHFWAGLGEDRIADVSAIQFGGARVFVDSRPDSYVPGSPCDGYRMTAWDLALWEALPAGWWRGDVRPFTPTERAAVERAFTEARQVETCQVRYGELMARAAISPCPAR